MAILLHRFQYLPHRLKKNKNIPKQTFSHIHTMQNSETDRSYSTSHLFHSCYTLGNKSRYRTNPTTCHPSHMWPQWPHVCATKTAWLIIISLGLTTPAAGHPSKYQLPRTKYWWASMITNIHHYHLHDLCSNQGTLHVPSRKLMALPTPQCPWSHLSLDSLIDIPESQVNTVNPGDNE